MEGNVSEMQLEHVLSPILNILNTSMNVSVELLERLYQGQQVNELLKDLNDAVNVVFQTQKSFNSFFSRASVSEMIDNLKDINIQKSRIDMIEKSEKNIYECIINVLKK